MLKRLITEKTAKVAITVMFTVAVFGALLFTRTAYVYSASEEAPPAAAAASQPAEEPSKPAAPPPAPASQTGVSYDEAYPEPGNRLPRQPAAAGGASAASGEGGGAGDVAPDANPAAEALPPLELGDDMPDPEALEAELARLSAMGLTDSLPGIINPEFMGDYYATAYCCEAYPHICGGNGVTASGTVPTPGLTAAADWKVLPPGTWLYIEGVGIRRVEDSGSAIKKQRLDIAIDTHDNALRWGGLGSHKVWVLAWDNTRLLR